MAVAGKAMDQNFQKSEKTSNVPFPPERLKKGVLKIAFRFFFFLKKKEALACCGDFS